MKYFRSTQLNGVILYLFISQSQEVYRKLAMPVSDTDSKSDINWYNFYIGFACCVTGEEWGVTRLLNINSKQSERLASDRNFKGNSIIFKKYITEEKKRKKHQNLLLYSKQSNVAHSENVPLSHSQSVSRTKSHTHKHPRSVI